MALLNGVKVNCNNLYHFVNYLIFFERFSYSNSACIIYLLPSYLYTQPIITFLSNYKYKTYVMTVYPYGEFKMGPTVHFCFRNLRHVCRFGKEQGRTHDLLNSMVAENSVLTTHLTLCTWLRTNSYKYISFPLTGCTYFSLWVDYADSP